MENPIPMTYLNDFVFCPVSIYFHSLDESTDKLTYQDTYQINGSAAHEKSDTAAYSSKKSMLQGISVYSEKFGLSGKIDVFDSEKGILTERKKHIKTVYDGYVFQLYAQYFALSEMGYTVNRIRLYSIDDNKTFNISLPEEDDIMFSKFSDIISDINTFSFDGFRQANIEKCQRCIYEPLCFYSCLKEEKQ